MDLSAAGGNSLQGAPDHRPLFLTRHSRKTLADLTAAIGACKGLILLTGETGAGKTMLLHSLLLWLTERRIPRAFVFNSRLEIDELYDFMVAGFAIPPGFRVQLSPFSRLYEWLLSFQATNSQAVLIVDEAQGLPAHVLEEIRMLLNLEICGQPLLQIVLSGQPELEAKFKKMDLRQLRQRIALRCKVSPLDSEETCAYIQQWLRVAGPKTGLAFDTDALEAIYFYSRGIPRVINILCERSLLEASSRRAASVPLSFIEEVARTYEFDDLKPLPLRTVVAERIDEKLEGAHPAHGALGPEISDRNGRIDRTQLNAQPEAMSFSECREPSEVEGVLPEGKDDRSAVLRLMKMRAAAVGQIQPAPAPELTLELPRRPVLGSAPPNLARSVAPRATDRLPVAVIQAATPEKQVNAAYIWFSAHRPSFHSIRQFFFRIRLKAPRNPDWIPSLSLPPWPPRWPRRWSFEWR